MDWFKNLNKQTKVAKEIGHGNTLEGQLIKQEMKRLAREVDVLRVTAATGGPESVLPRWRGEVRRQILLLPSTVVVSRMSMHELHTLAKQIGLIRYAMHKYSAKRLGEILSASKPGK
jgi:hypothetical protein